MQITARSNISKDFDVYLVPFTEENSYLVSIGKEIDKAIELSLIHISEPTRPY